MICRTLMTVVAGGILLVAGCGQRQVSYSTEVFPIIQDSCAECHSGDGEGEAASGFSVASFDDLMAGTQYGPVIVPGNAISSTLYLMISGKTDPSIQMPPHEPEALAHGRGEPLDEEQIETIRIWIDQGAKSN